MTELKSLRLKSRLTQKEAARKIGISLRSYISYENEEALTGTLKYRFLLAEMNETARLDEAHGVLSLDEIRDACAEILKDYSVQYCYLFGPYAKGKAAASSAVGLLIPAGITGLQFDELTGKLRETLHKKINLLDIKQLAGSLELLDEILKDGIRIYDHGKTDRRRVSAPPGSVRSPEPENRPPAPSPAPSVTLDSFLL